MSQYLSTNASLLQSRDEEFEEYERLYSVVNSSVSTLVFNLDRVKLAIHHTIVSHFNIAQNISDLYG